MDLVGRIKIASFVVFILAISFCIGFFGVQTKGVLALSGPFENTVCFVQSIVFNNTCVYSLETEDLLGFEPKKQNAESVVVTASTGGFAETFFCFIEGLLFRTSCDVEQEPVAVTPEVVEEEKEPENITIYNAQKDADYDALLKENEELRNRVANQPQTVTQTRTITEVQTITEIQPIIQQLADIQALTSLTIGNTLTLSALDCSGYAGDGKLTTDENGKVICDNDHTGGGNSSSNTDEQTLSFNTGTSILTISNGNTVDLSALSGGGGTTTVASLEDITDVASFTQNTGDLIYWNGTQWTNIATSSLGLGGSSVWSTNNITTGAYDISNGTFNQIALDVSSQEGFPRAMLFNDDGTTLYVLGDDVDDINEYTLSTPYDISTGSFTQIALSVSGQEGSPEDILFNDDGTTLYVIGIDGDDINEYTLSTPYDISTGSFTQIALSVSGQEANPRAMLFNDDGTTLYVLGTSGDDINEYTLSTPYDISTGSFTQIALNVGANYLTMIFNDDGTTLYLAGTANGLIYEYTLSTPYDVSTGSFTQTALNVVSQELVPSDILFNDDGSALYVLGLSGDDINEYTLTSQSTSINYANNVGVGTSSPTQKLHIAGNARLEGLFYDADNSIGSPGMVLMTTATGTRWVATSSLNISGSSNITFGTDNQIPYSNNSGNDFDYSANLTFDGSLLTAPTSTFSGNVGIGTTTPAWDLSIVGNQPGILLMDTSTAYANMVIANESSVFKVKYVDYDMVTPSTIFSIDDNNGNYIFNYSASLPTNGSAINNIVFGGLAGGALGSGSNNNILLGRSSGADATGSSNIFFGNSAGYSNTGDNNTYIGEGAGGGAAGAGSFNNAFGYQTGYGITSGSYNNLIGYQVGDALTTGSNNIAIGYNIDLPSNTGDGQLTIGNLIFGTGIDGTGTTISSGNIGIGTSSPSSKLSVYGDLFLEGTSRYLNFGIATGTNSYGIRDNGGTLQFKNSGGSWANIGTGGSSLTVGTDNQIPFSNAGGTDFDYSTNFTFDGSTLVALANVGIGTTSPAALLHLETSNNEKLRLVDAEAAGEYWSIFVNDINTLSFQNGLINAFNIQDDDGYVGIGGTGQDRQLEVTDTSNPQFRLTHTDSSIYTDFQTTAAGNLFINPSGGNVGIGTSSPMATLDIWGVGNQDLFALSSSSNQRLLTVDKNGNVGIGTTSPLAELDIYGDAILSGQNRYLNFGTVAGSSGYGFRDNAGTLEFKNSGGSWQSIPTGVSFTVSSSTYTSSNTWSKPADLSYVEVLLIGGGGSGGSGGNANAGGGGGGGNALVRIDADDLASTESVTVGAGGTGVSLGNPGNDGGSSSFGGFVTVGGGGGGGESGGFGAGGTGGMLTSVSTSATVVSYGVGGNGGYGDDAPDCEEGYSGDGPAATGGGGGASGESSCSAAGGSGSGLGGDGSSGSTGSSSAGGDYGGGSGGADSPGSSGAGGGGLVVVYEYFIETTGADLAELFPVSDQTLQAGELVSFDEGTPVTVSRADKDNKQTLAGIVSTAPGLLLGNGENAFSQRMVALSGRVPTRVNLENGSITIGDRIALSSEPGVGRKAKPYESSVGVALEPYTTQTKQGTIEVFIDLQQGYDIDAITSSLFATGTTTSTTTSSIWEKITQLAQGFVDGVLEVMGLRSREICLTDNEGETCIDRDKLNALLLNADIETESSTPDEDTTQTNGGGGTNHDDDNTTQETDNENDQSTASSTQPTSTTTPQTEQQATSTPPIEEEADTSIETEGAESENSEETEKIQQIEEVVEDTETVPEVEVEAPEPIEEVQENQ